MEEFLKTVARHYKEKSSAEAKLIGEPASLPLSRYLFCFPNRRSGLFFARHLQEAFSADQPGDEKTPCCVPPITTISELFGLFSTRHVIDRTALLFRLYGIYDRLSKRRERETFDQFVFWGDMLLSDFDDVDKYLVDADKLFSNVRDLKEIEAQFAGLTEEQIKVIKSFWLSFRPEVQYPEGDKHEVFGQTWSILAPLYHDFKKELSDHNLAYEGMMEREVVEILRDPSSRLHYDKVVFVGLTAVSEVDRRLMAMLKNHGMAEFCWDYADSRLQPEHSSATSAAYFTRNNLLDFGNDIPDEELQRGLVAESEREVSLYSVSSGVGQTQLVGRLLQEWQQTVEGFDPFRTAVVLPDEKLLLPMLYAVPQEFGSFNVTMGYSLKSTPVAAFVSMLAELQQSWREKDQVFYFRQVLPLLSHSFTLGVSGNKARKITREITEKNLYQVPLSLFADDDFLGMVFKPVRSATETLKYIDAILDRLMKRASRDIALQKEEEADEHGQLGILFDDEDGLSYDGTNLFTDIDYEFLYHYRKTLLQLEKEVRSHTFEFTPKTLFLLLEKLVAGVSVPFSGEPLKGLQLMGVLETRALDFDNVIILSMNEGVFPAKPVQNTFVPMSLRDAFGMPTQKHRDSVFAYHFYRLIGRAKRLAMIYDSRTEGMQTGEESRYVKQMRYLMGHHDMPTQTLSEDIRIVSPSGIAVRKTPAVMELLGKCLGHDGTRNFSATVLKDYIVCPLKFYLRFVRQLAEDDEVSEGVDAAIFGDILHQALCSLYRKCEGHRVEASMLEKYIDKKNPEVKRAVMEAFDNVMQLGGKPLEGYNQLVSQILENYVVETLRHDKELCPFDYLAGERKQNYVFEVSDKLAVRIKCIYDRLDRPVMGNANGTVRIVDYKTGSSKKNNRSKLCFSSVEDFFTEEGNGSTEAFQVMLYCLMLGQASTEDLQSLHIKNVSDSVSPHLYFVRDFHPRVKTDTVLMEGSSKDGKKIEDFSNYRKEFRERMIRLFEEIYNPDVPFAQCKDTRACKWCPFTTLCKRI